VTLRVDAAPTALALARVVVTPTLLGETETLTALVTGPSGPVTGGTVTFTVAGRTATATVKDGLATASLSLPPLATSGPQAVSAAYDDGAGPFAPSADSRALFFTPVEALVPSVVRLNALGETVTDLLFGMLSLSWSYDAQGRLTAVAMDGLTLWAFGYDGQGRLASIDLFGLPGLTIAV
jgi:YD repeat-containing protein